MKPFDGLDHSYTPEEYLQQVEARLTFAIGEEPQNKPIKYSSWHNRRMAYIQCSLITAYYAQVEAMSLMKKDKETVRHEYNN